MEVLNRTMPDDIYEVYMRIKKDIKYEVMISESSNGINQITPPDNGCVHIKLNNNEPEDEYFGRFFFTNTSMQYNIRKIIRI